jgi:hypothetical protein
MATLKVKKVKGREYFYWSKSVRSHKRFGGDGRVRTVDYLIGSHPLGSWLSYRLWNDEVQLEEYVKAVIKWLCPDTWEKLVKVSIDWKSQRVSIKSTIPLLIDCRRGCWRRERETLQDWVDQTIVRSTWIEAIVERGAYYLALSHTHLSEAKKLREFAKDARLHPDKFKADADLHFDEYASELETEADKAIERYLEIVNDKLLVFAPSKQRSNFRADVIHRAERLAKDKRWFDQCRAKWERS